MPTAAYIQSTFPAHKTEPTSTHQQVNVKQAIKAEMGESVPSVEPG